MILAISNVLFVSAILHLKVVEFRCVLARVATMSSILLYADGRNGIRHHQTRHQQR